MDPLTIGLGLVVLYLALKSGGKSGAAAPSVGASSASSSLFSGARRTANKLAGSQGAPGSPGAPGAAGASGAPGAAPLDSFAGPKAVTRSPSRSVATKEGLANASTGLSLAQTLASSAVKLAPVETALKTLPSGGQGIGAIINPQADVGFLTVQSTGRTLRAVGQTIAPDYSGAAYKAPISTTLSGGALISTTDFRPTAMRAGGALSSAGIALEQGAGLGAIGGSIGITAALGGFRGASSGKQKRLLGEGAVAGAQTAISVIPGVGSGLGAALGALAKTGEGQRAVMAAGRVGYQGYQFQKSVVSGHISEAFSGGGSSHNQRLLRAATLQAKQQTAKGEAAGFDQARKVASGKGAPGDVTTLNAATPLYRTDPAAYAASFFKGGSAGDAANKQANIDAVAAATAKNAAMTPMERYFAQFGS